MRRTGPALSIALTVALVAILALPASVLGQDNIPTVQCRADHLDSIGDSGSAPDVGTFGVSVSADGTLRNLWIATLLDRSELLQGEDIGWMIDTDQVAAGSPFGGDYLVYLTGGDGAGNLLGTYQWTGNGWATTSLAGFGFSRYTGGRIDWTLSLNAPGSSAAAPQVVRLQIFTNPTGGPNVPGDVAPGVGSLPISLEALSAPGTDPIAGYGFGSCVGGASGLGTSGPAPVQPTTTPPPSSTTNTGCASARQALVSVKRQLKRAKGRRRHARRAVKRRRYTRQIKRLGARRTRLVRVVRLRC